MNTTQQIGVENSEPLHIQFGAATLGFKEDNRNVFELECGSILGYGKSTGKLFYITKEEVEVLESVKREDEINFGSQVIAEMFPEAEKAIRRNINLLKKEISAFGQIASKIREVLSRGIDDADLYEKHLEIYTDFYVNRPRERIDAQLKKLVNILIFYGDKETGAEFSGTLIAAKAVPISEYIEFNKQGFAKCLWHGNERTGSMKWYKDKNHVYCFSCQRKWDVIDVVMKLFNIEKVPQAINKILNK